MAHMLVIAWVQPIKYLCCSYYISQIASRA